MRITWFYRDSDKSTAIIENTNAEIVRNFLIPYTTTMKTATDANVPMTAANRFSLNKEMVEEVDASDRIIPTPYFTVISDDAITFDVGGIYLENLELLGNLRIGATDLLYKLGANGNSDHKVSFREGSLPNEVAGPESYKLDITPDGTTITGTDAPGLFHGLMSLVGLLDVTDIKKMTLKEITIYDKPRFEYRGHQVDVARNFLSKEAIKNTIDAMALWKVRTHIYWPVPS